MPNCSSVKKIKPENYSESTNYDECIAQGYEPCQICDAHD